jgi:hypothetical protein
VALPAHDLTPPTIYVGTAAPGSAPRSRKPFRVLLAGPLDPSYRPVGLSSVSELKASETVLTGLLEDRSALFGDLAQIEALGLELLELRQIRARPTSRESGDDRPAHGV